MTAKEYLHQAYRLDHKINSDIEELQRLREMSFSISSPQLGDRVQTSRNTEAPFVKCIFKIQEMEEKIDAEIDLFVDLKKEIRSVIEKVEGFRDEVNRRLLKEEGGRLSISMAWNAFSWRTLAEKRVDQAFREMGEKLSMERSRPFKGVLGETLGSLNDHHLHGSCTVRFKGVRPTQLIKPVKRPPKRSVS